MVASFSSVEQKEGRALILVGILIVLILGVTKLNFPGWFVPVGIILAGLLLEVGRNGLHLDSVIWH